MNLGKKGLNGMILTVLIIVIVVAAVTILWSILSYTLSSAGSSGGKSFANFLRLLSPKEGGGAENVNTGTIPLVGACLIYNCNDSDSLIDFQDNEIYVYGNVTISNETFSLSYSDNCADNSTLNEYYYTNESVVVYSKFCGNESTCLDKACVNRNPVYSCLDSDASEYNLTRYEIFLGGNVMMFNETISKTWKDSCDGIYNVIEYYCEDVNNGFAINVSCGANSTCDAAAGACICGSLGEACCPQQKGDPCLGNLECKNNVCVSVVPPSSCGNGTIESWEECDNGNLLNGQRCTPNPFYGGSCTYCSSSCNVKTVRGPRCGDGVTQSQYDEQCDDGNLNDNDACKNDCKNNCGNNICDSFESCASCSIDCRSCSSNPNDGEYCSPFGQDNTKRHCQLKGISINT